MKGSRHEAQTHRFAWGGVSFQVPWNWELALQRTEKGVTIVTLEDEAARRLEVEWTRPRTPIDIATVRKRYARQSREIEASAEETDTLQRLPRGWTALFYRMKEESGVLLAYYLEPDGSFFSFFRLYTDIYSVWSPDQVIERIASSFRLHASGLVPWVFYDVTFELDAKFAFTGSALQAGSKLMMFEQRLRRLFIWHTSLADIALKERALASWAVDTLSKTKVIKGPRFISEDDGSVRAARSMTYPFGHYEEIGRQCFRYQVTPRHLEERNQLALVVFNYRREKDLEILESGLRLHGDPEPGGSDQ